MDDRGLFRTGFIFAILTAVSWAAFIAGGMMIPPAGEIGAVAEYLAVAESTGIVLYLWGGVMGSVLAVPTFLALLYGFRRETGSVLAVPVILGIIGLAYLALGFLVDSGSLIYLFGPIVSGAEGAEAVRLASTTQIAQDGIEATWAFGSFLGYGGPILWMAILFLRSKKGRAWLNVVGIIAGAAGFIWLGLFLPVEAPGGLVTAFIVLNVVLGMVWLIGMTGHLIRRSAD